ncbi:hypothetical protein UFOVP965_54 [uncultured Caudovirales phage]|uniref:Uncharacterized protein n=1 Tax=uncultured Caudovirales phage TaxID=2100421 RepID=A0A6J5QBG4_9CAUD|nr:hypothetical protein UFOVP965_54 [uncultured Caudovirales phage]CAB4179787.1 hypothetical protein UFOVP1035_50 [uncultured Caudovirales phage]CAB4188314.1 hypothetical protein UFOVP1181_9 [uncultured Caudovirales phage]
MSIQKEYVASTGDEFSQEQLEARPEATASKVEEGWDAADKASAYPMDFKFIDGEIQIVKFLDPNGPFAVYKQHFLSQITVGKRSFVSLGANDPLCVKLGSKPEEKKAFTIANLSIPGAPQRQILTASPRLYKSLHAAHFSPSGPLTKGYWALSRTGKMQSTVYPCNPVKARDLTEDWGIQDVEAIEAAIAEMVPFDRSLIKEPTWEELEAIADSLL